MVEIKVFLMIVLWGKVKFYFRLRFIVPFVLGVVNRRSGKLYLEEWRANNIIKTY